jgi:hypothetical protein
VGFVDLLSAEGLVTGLTFALVGWSWGYLHLSSLGLEDFEGDWGKIHKLALEIVGVEV